jgi:hypothetical protein
MTSALSVAPFPETGIVPASPPITYNSVGISQTGELYLYADTPNGERQQVPALAGLVVDLTVDTYGANSAYGARDYLSVHIAATPADIYVLRLPCHQGQWSYRSLLGCLLDVDVSATAVKIEPKRGRETTFLRVSLDPAGVEQVIADAIGPDRDDLEIAVNRVRQNLDLEPQFP